MELYILSIMFSSLSFQQLVIGFQSLKQIVEAQQLQINELTFLNHLILSLHL